MTESDQERINRAVDNLDELGQKLHKQALAEGFKDEICPNPECGAVILAHHHYIRCDPAACPMITRKPAGPDGRPATLLETLQKASSDEGILCPLN